MDARVSTEDAPSDGGMDATMQTLEDAPIAHDDAPVAHDDVTDAVVAPEDVNAFRPDALMSIDVGTDARLVYEAGPRDAGADVGTDAGSPGARDAGPDAPRCATDADCRVITSTAGGISCQNTACVSGTCVPSGAAFDCPPAGGCARACVRDPDTMAAVCQREGMLCAGVGDACDNDGQCGATLGCAFFATCDLGMCLPACASTEVGTTRTFTLPPVGLVTGVCDGQTFVPTGLRPAWCAIAVP